MSNDPSDRDPVDLLADEFTTRLRAGETPSVEEYAHRCPAHAATIRAVFPSIALVERISTLESTERKLDWPAPRFTATPPEALGEFQIVREVGRGGMGVVYEAVQSSLNRRVALKVLGAQVSASPTQLRRFRREAEAAAQLHHTNIVPIFAIGDVEGIHYYAMQFIEGASLGEVIHSIRRSGQSPPTQRNGASGMATTQPGSKSSITRTDLPTAAARSLLHGRGRRTGSSADATAPNGTTAAAPATDSDVPRSAVDTPGPGERYWRNVARIVAEVADALSYAHRHRVVHRDIKPTNLLLDRDGTAWVADFGLARHDDHEGITNAGDIVGTLRYMAPEQFNGVSDRRSDIYSLGLTLFELLTLRPAFDESRHGALIKSRSREGLPSPRSLDPRIPADLETITLKASATDPNHRYQRAEELADDLTRFLEGRPIRARRTTAPERFWRWCRREPVVASLAGASFLLLLTVAVVFAIGNYQTRKALASLGREHVRAEINLSLAIRAFEQIIGNISSRGIAQPAEWDVGGAEIVAPETALTVADVALLGTLLEFFDRFADENGTDLKVESASARRRVGDIQQRLGRFTEAEETYKQALEAYTELSRKEPAEVSWIVARAYLLNEMGVTASRRGNFMVSMQQHVEARKVLTESALALESAAGRFELARTLMLFCSIASRNGVDSLMESLRPAGSQPSPREGSSPRKGGRYHIFPGERRGDWNDVNGQAIRILHGLLEEDPAAPEYRLLLARTYREQVRIARLRRDRALAERSLDAAVEYLDELVADFPTHPGYQFALAEMLCTPVSLAGEPQSDPETVRRAERAVAISKELLATHPQISDHRVLHGATLNRLASLQQVAGHPEQARETYLQAIAIQELLSGQFPSVLHESTALAESLQELANVEVSLGRPEAAITYLESAITQLERFPKGNAGRFLPPLVDQLRDRQTAITTSMQSSSKGPGGNDTTSSVRD